MVTILALAAAMLYGTADFLGGVASRRASVFTVLALTVPAGAVVMVLVALLGEAAGLGGLLGPAGDRGDEHARFGGFAGALRGLTSRIDQYDRAAGQHILDMETGQLLEPERDK